jgi:hypothetical protein
MGKDEAAGIQYFEDSLLLTKGNRRHLQCWHDKISALPDSLIHLDLFLPISINGKRNY